MGSTQLNKVEENLLQLIPIKPKDISTTDLIEEYYAGNPPFNGRKIIVGRVAEMIRKLKFVNSEWMIEKTNRSGPNPIRLSRVRMNGKKKATK